MSDKKWLCESCKYASFIFEQLFRQKGDVECEANGYLRNRKVKKKQCKDYEKMQKKD